MVLPGALTGTYLGDSTTVDVHHRPGRRGETLIIAIGHFITVTIGVARIPQVVTIKVRLVWIRDKRTVVCGILHAIIIIVDVTRIPYVIPIGI